jgi:putative tricarboxylic transport membrane protein
VIEGLLEGFRISLSWLNLLYCFLGVTIGTFVGVLPGLGPAATIALLLPFTYRLDVTTAIIFLAGIYYGVSYGGTITSVLMKIPGEAATVVTCFDGHEMAKRGRAGAALGIAAFGSFIAGTLGVVGLMLLAPPLANLALLFGPVEYTALMLAGMTLVTYLTTNALAKALTMAVAGLVLGTVGLDPISGRERFTFGIEVLSDGINIGPLAMGLFGLSEVLVLAEQGVGRADRIRPPRGWRNLLPNRDDWRRSGGPIARGSVLGFLIGVLPGGGAVMASFLSYAMERRLSRHPEQFGRGAIEGVAGPESANNAGTAGAFIPLLTLGLPANVITALLLGAFLIHGVTPGPQILQTHPGVFWGVVTSMYVGNVLLLILNVPLIGLFVRVLDVPKAYLSPSIAVACLVGVYTVSANASDVLVMVICGLAGYLLRRFDFDLGPLMLAYVLGPLLERSLRQALIISDGNPMIFLTRPVSAIFVAVAILILLTGLWQGRRRFAVPGP